MTEEKGKKEEEPKAEEKKEAGPKDSAPEKRAERTEKPKAKGKAKAKEEAPAEVDAGGSTSLTTGVKTALDHVFKLAADERKAFITEYVSTLSVLELNDHVKALEEHFGVSAAPVAVGMALAAGAPGAPISAEAEEKTTFDVVLKAVGDKTRRVQVIKAVRDVLGAALKEAKAFVDGAPGTVKEGVSKEEAEKIREALETAGATVELK